MRWSFELFPKEQKRPSTIQCQKISGQPANQIPKQELTYNIEIYPFYNLKEIQKNTLVNQLPCTGVASIVMNHKLAIRLQHFLGNWEVITNNQWVLNTIQGYHIHFLKDQYQHCMPYTPHYTLEQNQLILKEVRELQQKGAVSVITTPQISLYFNLFLLPKKDGGQRPVINLNPVNQFVRKRHFKMEGIHTLQEIVRPNNWMVKVDLKDACLLHNTNPQHSNSTSGSGLRDYIISSTGSPLVSCRLHESLPRLSNQP